MVGAVDPMSVVAVLAGVDPIVPSVSPIQAVRWATVLNPGPVTVNLAGVESIAPRSLTTVSSMITPVSMEEPVYRLKRMTEISFAVVTLDSRVNDVNEPNESIFHQQQQILTETD